MTIDKSASAVPLHDKSADRSRRTLKFNGPASYVTGGDPVSGAEVGLGQIHVWPSAVVSNGTASLLTWHNKTTGKLMYFDMAGAEVANGTNLSAYTGYVEIIGK
jgi:hypothetical protein